MNPKAVLEMMWPRKVFNRCSGGANLKTRGNLGGRTNRMNQTDQLLFLRRGLVLIWELRNAHARRFGRDRIVIERLGSVQMKTGDIRLAHRSKPFNCFLNYDNLFTFYLQT